MAEASAPGKVYLFGEHAVVYGEPAVPCAIERRVTVTATPTPEGRIRIDAPALAFDGVRVTYGADEDPTLEAPTGLVRRAIEYVDAAIHRAKEASETPDAGVEVRIESDLPIGAGLGSSAAVTVATIDAVARRCGTTLERRSLADHAYRVEHAVQQGGASRADTFCSAVGGAVRVEGEECRSIEAPDLPLVIGYDGRHGDTGELVAGVRELKSRYGFVEDTIRSIGDLVRAGEEHLEAGDLDALGELMDIDHGLLSALGVSARSLETMVWAAREAGAAGAKLTGAGGGGCIVALDPDGGVQEALSYLPTCEAAFSADLATEGVRRG